MAARERDGLSQEGKRMSVFERIAKTVREHPWGIIVVSMILTVVLGLGLLFIKGQVTYYSLLPEGFPSIRALQSVRNDFVRCALPLRFLLEREP